MRIPRHPSSRSVVLKGVSSVLQTSDSSSSVLPIKYNIGGHNERTNLEVVKTILKALDKPESLIRYVKDRPGHDLRYAIDPTKIETEIGWEPKYNFDTGIKQTIEWYLENQDWWKHIISGEYSSYFDKMYGDRL